MAVESTFITWTSDCWPLGGVDASVALSKKKPTGVRKTAPPLGASGSNISPSHCFSSDISRNLYDVVIFF